MREKTVTQALKVCASWLVERGELFFFAKSRCLFIVTIVKTNHQHFWHEIECYVDSMRVMIRCDDHRKDN
jgi:hypothetical protein